MLEKGHQTPRYIIRDIIEPVVRDAIFNKENFPSIDVKIVNVNTTLSFRIHSQLDDQDAADRLLKFMSVWEMEARINTKKTEKYIFQQLAKICMMILVFQFCRWIRLKHQNFTSKESLKQCYNTQSYI